MKKFLCLSIFASCLLGSEAQPVRIKFRTDEISDFVAEKQKTYQKNVERLEANRVRLAKAWKSADRQKRTELIDEARAAIFKVMVIDIFPAWYGTTWDFNGTTETPGEGKIACGYFVTTCLRDAGFDLQRVKLAQQPSQRIIKTVANAADIKISAGKPMTEIEAYFREKGRGIYIVGLDKHTGFVVNDGKSLAFIHSSYYRPPFAVTAETVTGVNPLADSNYRVIGKILSDEMIVKWITGAKFEMKS